MARSGTDERPASDRGRLASHGDGEVFVDEDPVLAALFPDAGVANSGVERFSVFKLGGNVHGDDGPGDVAVPTNFQLLAGGQRGGFGVIQKSLANAGIVFLPSVVGERGQIVKGEAGVLGVVLGSIVRIATAPGSAVAIDKLTEGGLVGSFLLRASAGEGEQSAGKSKKHVHNPVMARSR